MSETKKVLLTKKYEITGLGSFHKVIPVGIYEVVSYANVYKIVSDGIYTGDNLPKELCQIAKEYSIEYVTKLEVKAARGEQELERLRKELEEAKQSVVEEAKQADMWHELYLRAVNDQDQQQTVSVLASFARTVIQKALNDESTSGGELKELAMEHLLIEEDPDQFEEQYRFTEVLALGQEGEGNQL